MRWAAALGALTATLLLGGCPNGCNWPEDECQSTTECLEGEVCVWSGNDGVGGHNFCLIECPPDQVEPCGRVECAPGQMWDGDGSPCLDPGTDPNFETYDATGTLVATGAWTPAGLGTNHYPCACISIARDGTWQTWGSDGQPLREDNYVAGVLHGPQRAWYPNGQLHTEYHYDMDWLHGPHLGWYENGQAEYEGQYEHGDGTGTWYYYYSDGALRGEVVYVNGRITEATYWDALGNPVQTLPPRSEA